MINKKAPKDMTAVEFVEYLVSRKEDEKVLDVNVYYTLEFLKGRLNEPAPNPFTPDQLAWMREEQRNGYNYAAIDFDGEVRLFEKKPMKDCTHWNKITGSNSKSNGKGSWLSNLLTVDDPEPLCFADFAPLEEK